VEELMKQGLSNEGIARRLECTEDDVQYLRERIQEFQG
jgi:DNA-binding CsgD family transcriptional regulator